MNTLFKYTALACSLLFIPFATAQDNYPPPPKTAPFFTGADLSYVNEMEDCGGSFFDRGNKKDPFEIFASFGADIVRVRLWHTPKNQYSGFDDVAKTIKRAKAVGMRVLLDFHYSDTWADPQLQKIPAAWENIRDTDALAKAMADYTTDTLEKLAAMDLTPNLVQVGNETNMEIMQYTDRAKDVPMDWKRNATLFNAGIKAVRDFSKKHNKKIIIILHIAQPENGLWWFPEAAKNGITDYDIMGLSYYTQWTTYKIDNIGTAISELISKVHKPVMIVETGYPWTLDGFDTKKNLQWKEALLPKYPATPNGQLDYLIALSREVKAAGGIGVLYWEPAWISTQCKDEWGQGSAWENSAFFDPKHRNTTLPAFNFFRDAKK